MKSVFVITHPDVVVDPDVAVPSWPLSERGKQRTRALLAQTWVRTVTSVWSSTEQKAIDTAAILAGHLSRAPAQSPGLCENDRSSTGFLPAQEFQQVADAFFTRPDESVRGWESAAAAQRRIVAAVNSIVGADRAPGSLALVSHGAVSTLLLCHLRGLEIDRKHEQPGQSGGNYFVFDAETRAVVHGWKPIDP